LQSLTDSGVKADVVVGSLADEGEQVDFAILGAETKAIVLTDGDRGGRWMSTDDSGIWESLPLPGPPADDYGAGDSFAAGLTFALGDGLPLADAVKVGASWGATAVCRRGPYGP
jgi:ribokinase